MNRYFSLLMVLLLTNVFNSKDAVAQKEQMILISTEFGDLTFKLYDDTPLHRDNFIKLVKQGFYDGTLFHRSMPYFMVQGGDPNSRNAPMSQSLGMDTCPTIPAEILPHHFHKKGALAAARLPDDMNPERKSSGCQFFIVQGYRQTDEQINANITETRKFNYFQRAWYKVRGGVPFLDGDYTVFGEIVDGLEVLDLILAVPTSQDINTKNRPLIDLKMTVQMLD